ncbi:hypothetical protein PoB_007283800 [Plakobranchus ocellatus]|uniref:Secreted protein n=1 Tax=Plakobranchus ocellatus TaxID=259542 RepID=A0AAV4DPT7_9GAST|nr:hypothetical protein PoB_007283800 [Plakobranchus ocellatus]
MSRRFQCGPTLTATSVLQVIHGKSRRVASSVGLRLLLFVGSNARVMAAAGDEVIASPRKLSQRRLFFPSIFSSVGETHAVRIAWI